MRTILAVLLTVQLIGCPKSKEKSARDTSAALKGVLITAQSQYQDTCSKDPSQKPCTTINKGVSAQNALITATELYCGWATSGPPPDPNLECKPISSFEDGLRSALANAEQATKEIKGILQ